MKKTGRSWKERICALLLAAAMIVTWMLPDMAMTAQAAPGDAGNVYFEVQDVENDNALLTQDIVIKVYDDTAKQVAEVKDPENTASGHENTFKVSGLDSEKEYTYTVEKTGYEYDTANLTEDQRKFTPLTTETSVEVDMKMSEISLDKTSVSLKVDEEETVGITNTVAEGNYIWSVKSGAGYVDVDNTGKITAKAAGIEGDDAEKEAIVEVQLGNKTKTVAVTVSKVSFTMGLSVNPGEGSDQNKVELSATGIPDGAEGTLTFKADGIGIGTANLPNTAVTYNDTDSIIGTKSFTVEYSGDTKYAKQNASASGNYTKTQELVIDGETSEELIYDDQNSEWKNSITIELKDDTIKGRTISAAVELADYGIVPNALSATDVADVAVNPDNSITVTPKNAGKVVVKITAAQGSTSYETATAEYTLTVNRKTVNLEAITWDSSSKVYDGETGIQLTGKVNDTQETVTIDAAHANMADADVALGSDNKTPAAKDVTITSGTYYATAGDTTANIQIVVEDTDNVVSDIATVNHRPLYLQAGNTELTYGQNMKDAVEGKPELITLLNGNGAVTPGDTQTGLVQNESAPVLPGATIEGTDEKLHVGSHEIIVPALSDSNRISGNYEFIFDDANKGTLTVGVQEISQENLKKSIVVVDAAGIYGIQNGDALDKVFASVSGKGMYGDEQAAPVLKLAVKNDAAIELDDYYDRVFISIGENNAVNATENGINLDVLSSLASGETDQLQVDDVKIYLGRSDQADTVSEETTLDNWLFIDNKAPVAEIDGFYATAYSKMVNAVTFGLFKDDVYNATVTITDHGSGIADEDTNPQQYYVKGLESTITDADLDKDDIKAMIEEIDQTSTWKDLDLSEDGTAEIPVGKAESEEVLENNYLIFIKTVDHTGNCAVYVSNGIVIEKQIPTIACEFDAENQEFTTADVFGYSGDAAYELTVTDPEAYFSGIDKVEVTVEQDGKTVEGSGEIDSPDAEQVYENSYTINLPDKLASDEAGYSYAELVSDSELTVNGVILADDITSNNVVLKVKATDRAGNVSAEFTQKLFIDDGEPDINVEFDKTNADTEGLPVTEYYQDSRTMTISYTDRNLGFNTTVPASEFDLTQVPEENIWFELKMDDEDQFSQYSLADLSDIRDDAGNPMIEVKLVSDTQPGITDESQYKDRRTVVFELKFVGQGEYTIIPHCADELKYTVAGTEEYFVVDTEDPEITDISYTCFDPETKSYVPFDPAEAKNTTVRVSVAVKEHFFKLKNTADFVSGQIGVKLKAEDLAEADKNDAEYYQNYYQDFVNDPDNWQTAGEDEWKISIDFANDANYTFDFTYSDLAGRADAMAQQTFTYDATAPNKGDITVTTNDGSNKWSNKFLNAVTFGFFDKFSNKNISVAMQGDDVTSGVVKIEHYDPAQPMSQSDIETLPDSEWSTYSESYEIAPDRQFVPYMKVTDRAGNVSYFSTESGFVADQTGPSVKLECTNMNAARNGIFNASAGAVKFRVTAQDVETETYSGIQEIWYEVQAKDNATGTIGKTVIFDAAEQGAEAQRQNKETRVRDFSIPITKDFDSNTVVVTAHAVDLSGNEVTDTQTVSIDITKPEITVEYNLNDPLNGHYYNATRVATVTVRERNFDPSAVRFNITNTDGTQPTISGWTAHGAVGVMDGATHTCTVTFAADGDYTFSVNATDLAGNTSDTVTSADFTIDQTDPTIQVTYDNNNDAEPGYFNADRTATITINEHNFNAADVNTAITASLEGRGVAVPGLSGWSNRGDVHTASVTFSADADYTFDVDYTDLAGNAAADYDQDSFTVDQTAPELEFFDIEDRSANNDVVAPGVRYSDNNYTENGVELTLTGANNGSMDIDGEHTSIPNGESIKMADFERVKEKDDLYTMTAVITDRAGNETEGSVIFSVNRFGSVYIIGDATKEWLKTGENERTYINEEQDVHVTEINVDSIVASDISYGRDGQIKKLEAGKDYEVKGSGSEVSWKQYDYTINKENFGTEGNYTVAIDSEDRATNVGNSRVKGCNIEFTVDKTAPTLVITGIEDSGSYRADTRDVTIDVVDNYAMDNVVVSSSIGGEEQEYSLDQIQEAGGKLVYTMQSANSDQDLKAVATDAAGNTAEAETVSVLLTSNLLIQYINNTPLLVGSIAAVVVIAGGLLWFFLVFKRRKEEEQANK